MWSTFMGWGEHTISEKKQTFIKVHLNHAVHCNEEHLELSQITKNAHLRLLYLA